MSLPDLDTFQSQLPKVRAPKVETPTRPVPTTGEVVNGSLALLLQDASDEDREHAYRVLAQMTGRSLKVSPIDVLLQVFPFVGIISLTLILVRAISFSRLPAGSLFATVMPAATAIAAFALFGSLVYFRRQPEMVFTIGSAAIACLISIALSSIL